MKYSVKYAWAWAEPALEGELDGCMIRDLQRSGFILFQSQDPFNIGPKPEANVSIHRAN